MSTATMGHAAEAPLEIEMFQAGSFADGVTFTEADVDILISNTKALAARGCKVPLVVGHREHGTPRFEQPAVGWLLPRSLRREGTKLLGAFSDIAPVARRAIERKLFRSASVEILPDVARSNVERHLNTGLTGPAVVATAVLGSTIPRCRGLADLDAYMHADDEPTAWHDGPEVFAEGEPAGDEPGKTVVEDEGGGPSVKERLARAEAALDEILQERAALAARQRVLADGDLAALVDADTAVMHTERRDGASYADLDDRLASAERMMAFMERNGREAAEVAERMTERFDETASGNPFAPPNAEDGPLGDVFLAEVEGRVRERGWVGLPRFRRHSG